MVPPAGVVAVNEVLQAPVEIRHPVEPATVKGGAVAFLEGGPLKSLAHGVVVRGAGGDPVVGEAQFRARRFESPTDVLGPVVGQHGIQDDPQLGEQCRQMADERGGHPGGDVAHNQLAEGPPGAVSTAVSW